VRAALTAGDVVNRIKTVMAVQGVPWNDATTRDRFKFGGPDTVVTGIATAFGALIPVAPLLMSRSPWAIWTSFGVAMLSHFGVGAARSFFTGRGVLRSGMDMFVVGLGVAILGYFVGEWIVRVI